MVRTNAVLHVSGQDFIFVADKAKDGRLVARQRPVRLGEIHDNCFEVLSGLKPRELVIVSNIQSLEDGMLIGTE